MYLIIDCRTGQQVGKPYKNLSRARARVDALDNAYGGYRYRVQRMGAL